MTLASDSCIAETRSAFPVARAVLVSCKWPEDTTQLDRCWQALWPMLAAAAFRSSSKPCMLLYQACRYFRRAVLAGVIFLGLQCGRFQASDDGGNHARPCTNMTW